MGSSIYTIFSRLRLQIGNEKGSMDEKRMQVEFVRTGQVGVLLVDTLPWVNRLPRLLTPWEKDTYEPKL